MHRVRGHLLTLMFAAISPELIIGTSFFLGRYPLSSLLWPVSLGQDQLARRLVYALRLPRLALPLQLSASLSTAGAQFPAPGDIRIHGRSIQRHSHMELSRHLALVPQSEQTPYPFSVLEYVSMGRAPHLGLLDMLDKHDSHLVKVALYSLEIGELADRDVQELSAATIPCDLMVIDELGPLEFEQGRGCLEGLKAVDTGQFQLALVVAREHAFLRGRWNGGRARLA